MKTIKTYEYVAGGCAPEGHKTPIVSHRGVYLVERPNSLTKHTEPKATLIEKVGSYFEAKGVIETLNTQALLKGGVK